jgi:hypothetical protein
MAHLLRRSGVRIKPDGNALRPAPFIGFRRTSTSQARDSHPKFFASFFQKRSLEGNTHAQHAPP